MGYMMWFSEQLIQISMCELDWLRMRRIKASILVCSNKKQVHSSTPSTLLAALITFLI
jgi:hypothetical protein